VGWIPITWCSGDVREEARRMEEERYKATARQAAERPTCSRKSPRLAELAAVEAGGADEEGGEEEEGGGGESQAASDEADGGEGSGEEADDLQMLLDARRRRPGEDAAMRERVAADVEARMDNGVRFDPRFLTFEFINNLVMRKQQHQLVTRFLKAAASGDSLCHQMIMGAGKTTGACRGVMVSPRVRGRAKVRVYENRRHPNSPCCPICSPDACGRCSVSHTSLASFEGVPYWVQSGNPRPEFGSP
jgi:hypothetical protein